MKPTFISLLGLFLIGTVSAVLGQGAKPVTVSLVSDQKTIVAGEPFYVGLKLEHAPGWHSYWTNPGVGQPTEVEWELPEGFSAGEKISPIPEVKVDIIGTSNIYHGTIYHLYQITPPADVSGSVTIKGTASWLQCQETRCDPPQKQAVSLTLPVGDAAESNAETAEAFKATLSEQPTTLEAWSVETKQTADTFTFVLTPGEGANPDPGEIYLLEEDQVLPTEKPSVDKEGEALLVSLTKEEEGDIEMPNGFFLASNGWLTGDGSPKVMSFSEKKASAGGGEKRGFVTLSGEEEKSLGLFKALVLAFIGGMILNLMPCVFPVLSIKILGFVDQAGEDTAQVKKHGLVFAAGVIISIWILAGILIGIKLSTGQQVGWGSHLSSPIVSGFIVILMFVLGLNLAGLFEIGTSLMGVGGDLMQKKGYSGSFFSGVLTTVVATPCSGPFLGAVMGFTFAQPIPIAFLLFTVFAMGVAAPYVILSFVPKLIDKLPRPGAWMETFKQIMAFPMFAAAIFFLNAFSGVTGRSGTVWLLVGMLVIAMGLWVYGRWCTPAMKKGTRSRGMVFALLLAFLGFYVSYGAAQKRESAEGGITSVSQLKERIRDLREEGKIVFADFTASW